MRESSLHCPCYLKCHLQSIWLVTFFSEYAYSYVMLADTFSIFCGRSVLGTQNYICCYHKCNVSLKTNKNVVEILNLFFSYRFLQNSDYICIFIQSHVLAMFIKMIVSLSKMDSGMVCIFIQSHILAMLIQMTVSLLNKDSGMVENTKGLQELSLIYFVSLMNQFCVFCNSFFN